MKELGFWDYFGIGYIKGHAVSLMVLAVIMPVWLFIRFDWRIGLLSVLMGYVMLMGGQWMWRYARRWEKGWQE
jgi:hypothetical protein